MRRLWILATTIALCVGTVSADNDRPITFEQLPKEAQTFIKKNFAESNITLVKEDPGVLGSEYDVLFGDGTKIEFNARGEWEQIKRRGKPLPEGIVPQSIVDYAHTHYPEAFITGVERDSRDYEVKLNTGIELTFDTQFNCIEIDS